MKNLLFVIICVLVAVSCKPTQGVIVSFDETKTYKSPELIMIHDEGIVSTIQGPVPIEQFLEIKEDHSSCTWKLNKKEIHIYCDDN